MIQTFIDSSVFKGLTLHQLDEAKKAFAEFDLDGNGVIDRNEFFQLIQQIHPNMPKIFLERIANLHFQSIDLKSGGIDQDEFLVVYSELMKEFDGTQ
jgi:Ca2+-binding EF-hand superfamily protein